jgi:hypothetical protein
MTKLELATRIDIVAVRNDCSNVFGESSGIELDSSDVFFLRDFSLAVKLDITLVAWVR